MEPTPVVEPIPAGEPNPEAEPNLAVEPALKIDPNPVVPILAHMTVTPFPIPTPAKSGIKTSLVAVKVLNSHGGGTDEKKREEFLREANMLKMLHHPNIMQVAIM